MPLLKIKKTVEILESLGAVKVKTDKHVKETWLVYNNHKIQVFPNGSFQTEGNKIPFDDIKYARKSCNSLTEFNAKIFG